MANIWKEFYVSPLGDDKGDGSKNSPFKTIEKAKEKVRSLNKDMKGDIVVHLNGDFVIDEPINFTYDDSGFGGFNVIWDGDNKKASISGGEKITGWEKVENTPLYKAKVDAPDGFRQFYVNGNRAKRARSKYLYYPLAMYKDPSYIGKNSDVSGIVVESSQFPKMFSRPEELIIVWTMSWKSMKMTVEKIEDNGDGTWNIILKQPYFDMTQINPDFIPTPNDRHPFHIENALEFLDEPGEWYFDKRTGELYYYPLENEDISLAECHIARSEGLIKIEGENENERVKNIIINGIDLKFGAWHLFEGKGFVTVQAEQYIYPEGDNRGKWDKHYSTHTIPGQISLKYAQNVKITNNLIHHLGSVAVSVMKQSKDCEISGNIIDDISATAAVLGDWDIEETEAPVEKFCCGIKFINNLVRRVSVEYFTNGITAYYLNSSQISHNDILDTPYTSISMGWGWGRNIENCANNKISYNKIENAMYRCCDGAHIYTLDPQVDTIIENNYLIKSHAFNGGFYLDNASAYLTIRNNVVEGVTKWLSANWHNVKGNMAKNNFCERPMRCRIMEQNSFEIEKGKVDGVWPKEAQDIINGAGLKDEYKYLIEEYEKNTNLRNVELNHLKWERDPGLHINPRNMVEGGEGVGYHDIVSNTDGDNIIGEPSIYEKWTSCPLYFIMETAEGEWTKHPFEIAEDGEYELILKLSAKEEGTAVSVYIDDECVAKNAPVKKTDESKYFPFILFEDNLIGKVNLKAGKHTIKVENAIKNFGLEVIRLKKPGEVLDRCDGFVPEIINAINK